MSIVTSYKQGTPAYVDLATTDEAGAIAFYGGLFGWTEQAHPMGPDQYYHRFLLKGSVVAGMYKIGPEMGDHPPYWGTYIAVDNVDEAGQRAVAAGGKLAMEPTDVFTYGRMVLVQDPQEAFIGLWQARDHIGSEIVNEPGSVVWNELLTSDADAAGQFYSKVLGVEVEKVAMPGMDYTLLKVGGNMVAGVMNKTPEMGPIPSHWAVYFAADDTDTMARKAESLGATIRVQPQDIPEVGRFAVLQDPQGAVFSIIKVNNPPA
jgi:predicted enzyme related to lactoylglutathione lyase